MSIHASGASAASSNSSVGANGSTIPTSSTLVAGENPSGNQTPVQVDASGNLLPHLNVSGSGSGASATVSTVATLTAPAGAVGFILQCLDTSTANIRWCIGRTASATLGQQLQPGRDSGFIPCGANVSVCSESGTQNLDIQWVSL